MTGDNSQINEEGKENYKIENAWRYQGLAHPIVMDSKIGPFWMGKGVVYKDRESINYHLRLSQKELLHVITAEDIVYLTPENNRPFLLQRVGGENNIRQVDSIGKNTSIKFCYVMQSLYGIDTFDLSEVQKWAQLAQHMTKNESGCDHAMLTPFEGNVEVIGGFHYLTLVVENEPTFYYFGGSERFGYVPAEIMRQITPRLGYRTLDREIQRRL